MKLVSRVLSIRNLTLRATKNFSWGVWEEWEVGGQRPHHAMVGKGYHYCHCRHFLARLEIPYCPTSDVVIVWRGLGWWREIMSNAERDRWHPKTWGWRAWLDDVKHCCYQYGILQPKYTQKTVFPMTNCHHKTEWQGSDCQHKKTRLCLRRAIPWENTQDGISNNPSPLQIHNNALSKQTHKTGLSIASWPNDTNNWTDCQIENNKRESDSSFARGNTT